jgi:hypothetical protein
MSSWSWKYRSGDAMRRWIFKCSILLVVVAGFLAGLIALGQWSLEQIRQRERYTISFSDIDCTPPAGMERTAFLEEVEYEAGHEASMPKSFCLLDDDLGERLAAVFRMHPWVADVVVELEPPKRVHVELIYRVPVLAVKLDGALRAVDKQGVLLPKTAATDGLPVYPHEVKCRGKAGTPLADPGVEKMAKAK